MGSKRSEARPGRQLAGGRGSFAARRIIARASGARLCFGKPVRSGDVAVVPVASVRGAGGAGFGKGTEDDEGAGGGGFLSATPVGYIEIRPDGARFHRIVDPVSTSQAAVALLGAGVAAYRVRRAMQGPRAQRLLKRG